MRSAQPLCSNFAHLGEHDDQLLRLGLLAERYFPDDPNTALIKLRQLAELLGQWIAAKVGLYESPAESQFELLRRLRDRGLVPREIAQLFDQIRPSGNAAAHGLEGDHKAALAALKIAWQLSVWFHRTFKHAAFKSGPFVPPAPPRDEG
jgi:type I restriction enzyme R subunit